MQKVLQNFCKFKNCGAILRKRKPRNMADLQTQFNKFHEAIKIDFEGNKPLREKRDMILVELRAGLKKKYPINTPTFKDFVQGSYDLATGVKPLQGEDYDIDVGLNFNLTTDQVKPVDLKEIVYDILNSVAKRTVLIKRPCVRVQYHNAGEVAYHIDLAIYAHGKDFMGNMNDTLYIAKGYWGSAADKKIWETSEPYQLKELIKSKISDKTDREQFRRVVRYLKRWKDYNFSSSGTERPTGIALTALCYNLFTVEKDFLKNPITGVYGYKYNDLRVLIKVINGIIGSFNWSNKLSVQLPVKPYNNLCEKMSDNQMLNFKTKLQSFKTILENASNDTQITTACMRLRGIFGGDFPNS